MSKRRSAALVASILIPAASGALICADPASAAPSLIITNQGPASDNNGHTATGWTGYVLTAQCQPGHVVATIDIASTGVGSFGIFGTLLQQWHTGKSGAIPTPLGDSVTDTNGSDDGTDTHWLIQNPVTGSPIIEDSDQVNPVGAPVNDPGNIWGTGTYLHGAVGIIGASQVNTQPTAYIVTRDNTPTRVAMVIVDRDLSTGAIVSFNVAATIPEPTSGSLMISATAIGLIRRRRRRANRSGAKWTTSKHVLIKRGQQ